MTSVYLLISCIIFNFVQTYSGMFTINKNDPAPIYSTVFPYFYLYNKQNTFQLPMFDYCVEDLKYNFQFSFTPFYQRSDKGSNFCECLAQLGDLTGRPNLLAVLPYNHFKADISQNIYNNPCDNDEHKIANIKDCYSDIPCELLVFNKKDGLVVNTKVPQFLYEIRDELLACVNCENHYISCTPEKLLSVESLLALQNYTPNFGTYSVPIRYRKAGVRFQGSFMFSRCLGVNIQFGFANISQCPTFISQNNYCPVITTTNTTTNTTTSINTCNQCTGNNCSMNNSDFSPTCGTLNPIVCKNPLANELTNAQWQNIVTCVENTLMSQLRPICDALNLDVCNFSRTAIEDVHAELLFRQGYEFGDPNDLSCWSNILLVPFASVGGSLGVAPERDQNVLFALPNGNDGHNSVDFRGGFSVSFKGTIEATAEAGFTHFYSRKSCNYRIPTNDFQRFIYPYGTSAKINPGNTWHIGLCMNAYHFIDNLSFYAQYLLVNHDPDRIYLLEDNCTGGFKPDKLECLTAWKNNLATVCFNYDFTPQVSLGLLWQFSMKRANNYNNNTFMLSLILNSVCD